MHGGSNASPTENKKDRAFKFAGKISKYVYKFFKTEIKRTDPLGQIRKAES